MSTVATSRIAVVTGASSGIGRSASVALNAAGWTVILSARRKEMLEETVDMMGSGGKERARVVVGDLAKAEDVKALFEVVRREYGMCPRSSLDRKRRERRKYNLT